MMNRAGGRRNPVQGDTGSSGKTGQGKVAAMVGEGRRGQHRVRKGRREGSNNMLATLSTFLTLSK